MRELANVMTGAALLAQGGRVGERDVSAVLPELSLVPATPAAASRVATLATGVLADEGALPCMRDARELFDRAYLEEALRRSRGNVTSAAKLAERNRTDFHDLLRRHGIDANEFRE